MAGYVLITDDDPDVITLVDDILGGMNYQSRGAANGQDALEMAHAETPAAIILDLEMPVMNGIEFMDVMESDAVLQSVPVIVLSAFVEDYEDQGLEDRPMVIGVLRKGRPQVETLRNLLNQAINR